MSGWTEKSLSGGFRREGSRGVLTVPLEVRVNDYVRGGRGGGDFPFLVLDEGGKGPFLSLSPSSLTESCLRLSPVPVRSYFSTVGVG